jgi:hypothetical protein
LNFLKRYSGDLDFVKKHLPGEEDIDVSVLDGRRDEERGVGALDSTLHLPLYRLSFTPYIFELLKRDIQVVGVYPVRKTSMSPSWTAAEIRSGA